MGRVEDFLQQRKEKSRLRVLRPASFRREGRIHFKDGELFDFCSNDYLGLAGHPRLAEAAQKATEKLGAGSSASRLLSGDLEIHHQLEDKTARLKGKESAVIFNSGYQANVGIISCLCRASDAVFSDRLNHASIVDGIRLSGAKLFRFHHNDVEHLESLLEEKSGSFNETFIITETVFSMDGDIAKLGRMVELKERFGCKMIVDEAHATGIFGKDGSGMVSQEGLTDRIDFIMGTFSKALGSFGAYVACSERMAEFLINSCRSFIYSTALPPAVVAANLAALELLEAEPFRRKVLLENAEYFRGELGKKAFDFKGSSQIVPLIVGDDEKAVKLSAALQDKGYWCLPIRPPTVPEGRSRLRFSVTYDHSREVLRDLVELIHNSWEDICNE